MGNAHDRGPGGNRAVPGDPFGFRYNFRKIGFNFRNTFGKMFQKGEGTGTVSGFAAACTAMANTIGVGNIGGVATAIVAGGPGAVFWMWVSGLLGMSTKACEISWASATGSSTASPWTSICATAPS